MPYGLKRFQKAKALHFITFSCFHRLPFLEAPATKETFELVLERTRSRHQAGVCAYVLMPEHIHLLINEPPLILVAQFLKALKQITSRKLRGDRPQFWQDRYFDSNVRGESARSEVIRSIHRNPLKRGLVASPEQYRWSSFNRYATGVRGVVEIESEWTASTRGPLIATKPRCMGHRIAPCEAQRVDGSVSGPPACCFERARL
ncbi:MAG TPA: transposase [Terracidiphilus sp.]|nr:transposase [Terracidiphilus sp.]